MKLDENGDKRMLSLVIPALNEEAAIQSTLERAVRAVKRFKEEHHPDGKNHQQWQSQAGRGKISPWWQCYKDGYT